MMVLDLIFVAFTSSHACPFMMIDADDAQGMVDERVRLFRREQLSSVANTSTSMASCEKSPLNYKCSSSTTNSQPELLHRWLP